MRAEQGKAATFQVGTRYPVLTASFSPLLQINIPSQLARANNAQPLTPSFQFEDLGLTLKATPQVTGAGEVILQFEMSLKGLSGQSLNGIPAITNREYKGSISLKDGEKSVIAGQISNTESRSLTGLPLIGRIPGLRQATGTTNRQNTMSQVLIVLTPHILSRAKAPGDAMESYLD